MKSILIAIDCPQANGNMDILYARSEIFRALRDAQSTSEGVLLFGDSCALVPSASGLPVLAAAISAAEQAGFAYKVMFIESSETWERAAK